MLCSSPPQPNPTQKAFTFRVSADMFCNSLCVPAPIQLRRIRAVDLKVKVGWADGHAKVFILCNLHLQTPTYLGIVILNTYNTLWV